MEYTSQGLACREGVLRRPFVSSLEQVVDHPREDSKQFKEVSVISKVNVPALVQEFDDTLTICLDRVWNVSMSFRDVQRRFSELRQAWAYTVALLDWVEQGSSSGPAGQIISPIQSQPSSAVASSSAGSVVHSSSSSSSNRYSLIPQAEPQKRGKKQSQNAPKQQCFLFDNLSDPILPLLLPTFIGLNAMINDHHSGRQIMPGKAPRLELIIPDPAVFVGTQDDSKHQVYLTGWHRLEACTSTTACKVDHNLLLGLPRHILSPWHHGTTFMSGFAAEKWRDCVDTLKSLARLMRAWPGKRDEIWEREKDPNLAQLVGPGMEWEKAMYKFYVQSYFNNQIEFIYEPEPLRPREYFYPVQFIRPDETTNLRLESFVSKIVSENPQHLHNKWLRLHHAIWWNEAPTYDTHHSEYVLIQIVHNLEEDCTEIHVSKKVPVTQFHVTDQNLVYGRVVAEDDFPRRTNHLENYNTQIYISY
ncbi:hypothetical protein PQX77_019643 [Marasmius sp. AFHP31]|nr:hypothetical protein PQX77_019643 [Marasmius sp. AFHP31]